MNRYLLSIVIICTFVIPLHPSTSRHVWWNNRIVSLQKDRDVVNASGKPDPAMIDFLDQEIAESRKVLQALEGGKDGKGKNADTAIISRADDIARGITSLVFLEEVTGERSGKSFNEKCDSEIRRKLAGTIKDRFGRESKTLSEQIIENDISNLEKKTITFEMYLGSVMSLFAGRNDAARTLAEETEKSIRKDEGVTGSEVSNKVADAVLKYLASGGTGIADGPGAGSLDSSWTWKRITSLLDARFKQYEQIMAQSDSLASLPPERIRYYYNNPSELDGVIFRIYDKEKGNAGNGIPADISVLRIPADPDFYAAACELDSTRRLLLGKINGKENDGFFASADAELSASVRRNIQEAADVYTQEEMRLAASDEKKRRGMDASLVNAEEFRIARKNFSLRYGRLVARKNRSMDLLHLVSGIRAGHACVISSSCDFQQKRLQEYLDFLNDLMRGCVSIPSGDSRGVLERRYLKAAKGIDVVMKFFGMTLSVEDKYRIFNQGAEKEILALREKGKIMMADSGKSVLQAKKDFIVARKAQADVRTRREKEEPSAALSAETGAMTSSLERCTGLLATYTSAEKFIEEYRNVYSGLEEAAASGDESGDMKKVLETRSVLPLLSYNREMILMERKNREYLKRDGMSQLARLVTLRRSVGGKGSKGATDKQLSDFRGMLSARKTGKIASWCMDETNIEDVDARAAARLEQIIHRAMWRNSTDTIQDKTILTLGDVKILFSVPKGWARNDDGDKTDAVTFRSPDESSSISIIHTGGDKPSLASEVEKLSGVKGRVVMKKWGKREGSDFYYVYTKGKKDMVYETYGMVHDGKICLFSGETRKDRYNLFSPLLKRIFETVEFI